MKISISFVITFVLVTNLQAFVLISNNGKPAYWPGGNVDFKIYNGHSGDFPGNHDFSGTSTSDFSPIRAAFQTWEDVSQITLNISDRGTTSSAASSDDGTNTIQWVKSGWTNLNFNPPSNALAVTLLSFDSDTGEITDADIYFNADDFQWAVVDDDSENDHIDVGNIATHEIGHFLGIDHSSENLFEGEDHLYEATMFYASSSGETERRSLEDDDINAIRNLYGSVELDTPTISSVKEVGKDLGEIEYEIRGTNFAEQTAFVLSPGDSDYYDSVSRYREIISPTRARVIFDVMGLPAETSTATVIAFNNPSTRGTYEVRVKGGGFAATNSGGGGGCELSAEGVSLSTAWGVLLILGALIYLRRRKSFALPLKIRSTYSKQRCSVPRESKN